MILGSVVFRVTKAKQAQSVQPAELATVVLPATKVCVVLLVRLERLAKLAVRVTLVRLELKDAKDSLDPRVIMAMKVDKGRLARGVPLATKVRWACKVTRGLVVPRVLLVTVV